MTALLSTNGQYEIAAYICRKFGANDADQDQLDGILEFVDIESISMFLQYTGDNNSSR